MQLQPRLLRRGMGQLTALVLVLTTLVPRVFADLEFVTPSAGESYSAANVLTITWQDDGQSPSLADMSTTTLMLCGNTDLTTFDCFYHILPIGTPLPPGNTYAWDIPAAQAADGQYFLQMTPALTTGGYMVIYSNRFTLTGMTGTQTYVTIGDTSGPANEDHQAAPAPTASDPFAVSYQDQGDWLTKYAPMQPQPGTTVTAKSVSRQYPTSKIGSIFLTNTMRPSALTTTTMPWSYTLTSVVNEASPQPDPSANGGSYEASKKKKKRRWED
ncbi:hypothetical protein V1517DRAFT_328395 [Lipomyces orientalis]|uniref:Uncharacterized protein n=1 Tax=Lipomyces orientalis TaxID=1233043 RepID=A0ACC3TIF5_9ASCO